MAEPALFRRRVVPGESVESTSVARWSAEPLAVGASFPGRGRFLAGTLRSQHLRTRHTNCNCRSSRTRPSHNRNRSNRRIRRSRRDRSTRGRNIRLPNHHRSCTRPRGQASSARRACRRKLFEWTFALSASPISNWLPSRPNERLAAKLYRNFAKLRNQTTRQFPLGARKRGPSPPTNRHSRSIRGRRTTWIVCRIRGVPHHRPGSPNHARPTPSRIAIALHFDAVRLPFSIHH